MRSHYAKNRTRNKKRANQRAAKERKRVERALREYDYAPEIADAARCGQPTGSGLRFRVTIECLSDGAKATFTTAETPFGFTASPKLCGERVATVIRHYRPDPSSSRSPMRAPRRNKATAANVSA